MKCESQTLQIEWDGFQNTSPRITVILKGIKINCANTGKLDAIGSETINIPRNRRLPNAIPPARREKWREGALVALVRTTQWSCISVPHMAPTNLILQTVGQQITLETAKK